MSEFLVMRSDSGEQPGLNAAVSGTCWIIEADSVSDACGQAAGLENQINPTNFIAVEWASVEHHTVTPTLSYDSSVTL